MPLLMGAAGDAFSVGASFFVMGGLFLVILLAVAVWARGKGDMT
jgi:hypothetical protein